MGLSVQNLVLLLVQLSRLLAYTFANIVRVLVAAWFVSAA